MANNVQAAAAATGDIRSPIMTIFWHLNMTNNEFLLLRISPAKCSGNLSFIMRWNSRIRVMQKSPNPNWFPQHCTICIANDLSPSLSLSFSRYLALSVFFSFSLWNLWAYLDHISKSHVSVEPSGWATNKFGLINGITRFEGDAATGTETKTETKTATEARVGHKVTRNWPNPKPKDKQIAFKLNENICAMKQISFVLFSH